MKRYATPSFGTARVVIALAIGLLASLPAFAEWTHFPSCRLSPDGYFDGDSFDVITPQGVKTFRLFFTDCAETDTRLEERIQEQATYWKVTPEEVLKSGKEATEFSAKLLGEKDFEIYTYWQDAKGGSRKRYFAFIKIDGEKWLGEELVKAGLARAYGKQCTLPDGTSIRDYWARLNAAAEQAEAKGLGIFAGAGPANMADAAKLVDAEKSAKASAVTDADARVIVDVTKIYSVIAPIAAFGWEDEKLIGMLIAGSRIKFPEAASDSLVKAYIITPSGEKKRGKIRRADINRLQMN